MTMVRMILALAVCMTTMAGGAWAQWSTDESQDKMTGKVRKTASVLSSDSLSLGFPYQGSNHGVLGVRRHPQFGLDVYLRIDKGQILCSSYRGCKVLVKFDAAAPVSFEGAESADHDSSIVFIENPNKFIGLARKAQSITVQIGLYQNGMQTLTFNTPGGLTWK